MPQVNLWHTTYIFLVTTRTATDLSPPRFLVIFARFKSERLLSNDLMYTVKFTYYIVIVISASYVHKVRAPGHRGSSLCQQQFHRRIAEALPLTYDRVKVNNQNILHFLRLGSKKSLWTFDVITVYKSFTGPPALVLISLRPAFLVPNSSHLQFRSQCSYGLSPSFLSFLT